VGDRVQVRNRDDEQWRKGTVKELVDGRPKAQEVGDDYAYSYAQVQLLVIHYLEYSEDSSLPPTI
jgi:hypothetical protein